MNRTFALALATAFLAFVAVSTIAGRLPIAVLGLYLVSSLITYVIYATDKSAAKRGRWRTKESTLHLLGLAGGWPGALVAQYRLRHKSRKLSFRVVFLVTVILNCGALGWLFTAQGAYTLRFLQSLR